MRTKRPKKELLSPAGSYEKMEAAFRYGADAVYLAGNMFGMRSAAKNFEKKELFSAFDYARSLGKKVYLTVNTLPRGYEYPALKRYLRSLKQNAPDALIIGDIGVMALAKDILPDTDIHISTQLSCVSAESAGQWHKLGASRVVLAREISLSEISAMRRALPKTLELEAFIHGSMCVSYSGRCLLSNYFTGRDANRGMCAQPCRWNFTGKALEITEQFRPEEQLPVYEDENGTYVMSSKDLCMIEHIPELMESGIYSFKIEGRMKSAYYTAVVTNAYRMAIDAYLKSPENYKFDPLWRRELESVSHREYATGFYFESPTENAQLCAQKGYIRDKAYLATVLSYDERAQRALFTQKNKLGEGDAAEIVTPGLTGRRLIMEELENADGAKISATPHPKMIFSAKVPFPVKPGDILRGAGEE